MPEKILLDLDVIEAAAIAAKAVCPGNPWFYQEKSDAYTHIVRVENPALNNSLIVVQMAQRTDGRPEALARYFSQSNPDVVLALIAELKILRAGTAETNWQAGYDEGRRMGTKTALLERDGLRKDAARYRWLRANTKDQKAPVGATVAICAPEWLGLAYGEKLDQAVDGAMTTLPNPA